MDSAQRKHAKALMESMLLCLRRGIVHIPASHISEMFQLIPHDPISVFRAISELTLNTPSSSGIQGLPAFTPFTPVNRMHTLNPENFGITLLLELLETSIHSFSSRHAVVRSLTQEQVALFVKLGDLGTAHQKIMQLTSLSRFGNDVDLRNTAAALSFARWVQAKHNEKETQLRELEELAMRDDMKDAAESQAESQERARRRRRRCDFIIIIIIIFILFYF
jgi:hypothetical protein